METIFKATTFYVFFAILVIYIYVVYKLIELNWFLHADMPTILTVVFLIIMTPLVLAVSFKKFVFKSKNSVQ